MFAIAKFLSRTGRLGTPLPDPFPVFGLERVRFRHGGVSMVAGKPGSGKSIFALNLLTRWSQENIPCMYFSADSDEFTVARRLAGIISGNPADRIEQMPKRELAALLTVDYLAHARFEYRTGARDDEEAASFVAGRMAAYEAVYGAYPAVVFVDNLINYAPSANDWGFMIDLLRELDELARETMSHICVLHHASEAFGNPNNPVPSAAIQGKVTQIPRLVLTIASSGAERAIAAVKNTNGQAYPDASHYMSFTVEDSLRMQDNYQEMIR